MTYEELVSHYAEAGIVISPAMVEQLKTYAQLLMKWNEVMNLTAIKSEPEIVEKHFFDSLLPAKVFNFHSKSLVDIGSGAGFPGFVLAIVFPDCSVSLVDATKKKFEFLQDVKDKLGLKNVTFINARVEDLKTYREHFGVAISRAFGSLSALIEVGIPLLKVNGTLIVMKSAKGLEELQSAGHALQQLESKISQQQRDTLPSDHDIRINIFISKGQKTTPKYPRKWADIVAKPL
jgi:16S rRNA (guanine527-N7)-methyltransferase